ncbi:MAG: hypothetical protein M1374_04715, partial [Firmicutes bacterium]|nr:hypothetical protein [Bacillota bacterium]
ETWVRHRNADPKPFEWHADAHEIIEKVRRGRKTLSQVKSATQHYVGMTMVLPSMVVDLADATDYWIVIW